MSSSSNLQYVAVSRDLLNELQGKGIHNSLPRYGQKKAIIPHCSWLMFRQEEPEQGSTMEGH